MPLLVLLLRLGLASSPSLGLSARMYAADTGAHGRQRSGVDGVGVFVGGAGVGEDVQALGPAAELSGFGGGGDGIVALGGRGRGRGHCGSVLDRLCGFLFDQGTQAGGGGAGEEPSLLVAGGGAA